MTTESKQLALFREWAALRELAAAQAETAKKTADARDSKLAELTFAMKGSEVLR